MEAMPVRTLDEVQAVARFMQHFPGQWWFGGGWAIDLWLGQQSRDHEDIEICVWRDDQRAVHDYCAEWQFYTSVSGEWAAMADGEMLAFPRFMLHLRRTPDTVVADAAMPPTFEYLLNDMADGQWQFQPESDVRAPLEQVVVSSPFGFRVTAPEIVLLHKAWHAHRAKDDHDFARVRDRLGSERQMWLAAHLMRFRPGDPWLAQLR